MGRLLLGLLKGLVIGGGAGVALLHFGIGSGVLAYLAVAVVGATVGLICGRAPWRAETIWTPVLKMLFGLGVSVGLFALGRRFAPELSLDFLISQLPKGLVAPATHLTLNTAPALVPGIGMLYGAFVEVDDGGEAPQRLQGKEPQRRLPKQQQKQLED